MPVLYAPESAYAKEMVKHESQHTQMGPGLRPYVYREYPMMMHKAGPPASGLGAITVIETTVVNSEKDEAKQRSLGFRRTPLEAIADYDGQALEIAKLAAEIEYDKAHKLSPAAIAEVESAQEAVAGHLATVPVTPIAPRKRGRPAKVKE